MVFLWWGSQCYYEQVVVSRVDNKGIEEVAVEFDYSEFEKDINKPSSTFHCEVFLKLENCMLLYIAGSDCIFFLKF